MTLAIRCRSQKEIRSIRLTKQSETFSFYPSLEKIIKKYSDIVKMETE